jgi:hypothetical protein
MSNFVMRLKEKWESPGPFLPALVPLGCSRSRRRTAVLLSSVRTVRPPRVGLVPIDACPMILVILRIYPGGRLAGGSLSGNASINGSRVACRLLFSWNFATTKAQWYHHVATLRLKPRV